MRTLLLKLLSLLVLAAGLLLAAAVMDPTGAVKTVLDRLPDLAATPAEGGAVDWRLVGGVAGLCFALLGVAGLLTSRRRGARRISFRGDHGEVVIELDSIQKTLSRVIKALPEVRRARVCIRPEKDGRSVRVRVVVLLQNLAGQDLRKTVNLASECITKAVSKSMGLEELATVQLVVRGVHVDARATARHLHDEAETRAERESTDLAAALARPPISSVTMEELEPAVPEPVEEALQPPLAPAATEEAKAAAPEPVEEVLPPLAPVAVEEARMPELKTEETALPPLSSFALEDFETDAPKPAAESELMIEDLPLAVGEASGDAEEDDLPPLDQSDFSTSSLRKPLPDESVS